MNDPMKQRQIQTNISAATPKYQRRHHDHVRPRRKSRMCSRRRNRCDITARDIISRRAIFSTTKVVRLMRLAVLILCYMAIGRLCLPEKSARFRRRNLRRSSSPSGVDRGACGPRHLMISVQESSPRDSRFEDRGAETHCKGRAGRTSTTHQFLRNASLR